MAYPHRNGETEPPTETGYYWFRYNVKTDQLCHICQVRRRVHSGLYAVWPGVYTDRTVIEKCMVCFGDGGFWFCGNCGYSVTDAELREPSELNQRED